MNSIRPWLWIGKYLDTLDAEGLAQHGIGAMLQLAESVEQTGIESLYLSVEDGVPLSHQHLRQGMEFILAHKHLGRAVLVACGAGMSRSAVFTIAALREVEGLSLMDTLRAVKQRHPDTLPHPRLWESLCSYYQEAVPYRSVIEAITAPG